MYCVTIAKIVTMDKTWAGFNTLSQLMSIEELKKECTYYGVEFEEVSKGSLNIIEVDWHKFTVMIQYRKIS